MFYSPRNRGNMDRFYCFRSRSISAAQAPRPPASSTSRICSASGSRKPAPPTSPARSTAPPPRDEPSPESPWKWTRRIGSSPPSRWSNLHPPGDARRSPAPQSCSGKRYHPRRERYLHALLNGGMRLISLPAGRVKLHRGLVPRSSLGAGRGSLRAGPCVRPAILRGEPHVSGSRRVLVPRRGTRVSMRPPSVMVAAMMAMSSRVIELFLPLTVPDFRFSAIKPVGSTGGMALQPHATSTRSGATPHAESPQAAVRRPETNPCLLPTSREPRPRSSAEQSLVRVLRAGSEATSTSDNRLILR